MDVPELLAEPWAMSAESFELFVKSAQRGMTMQQAKASAMGLSPEAILRLGAADSFDDPLDVRDGTAVIPVRGLLTRRAYWRGDRASYEWIGEQLSLALQRPDVSRILLEVDSGGGQVNGTEELSSLIFEARGEKPITAQVLGQAESAAYWIASSASRIVAGRTSMLGSIGVIWTFVDWSKFDAEHGIEEISIVSSQSPNKDIDPKQAEGSALVQATVDQLAGEFVEDVARNRGVDEATVISDFGGGWVLVGDQAVEAGMADSIGRYEDAITDPDPDATSEDPQPASAGTGGHAMSSVEISKIDANWLEKNCPAVVAGIRAGLVPRADLDALRGELEAATSTASEARVEGATGERDRIVGILDLSGRKVEGVTHALSGVFDEHIAEWVADPSMSVEMATKQYDSMAKAYDAALRKKGIEGHREDEANLDTPDPSDGGDGSDAAASIKAANDVAARAAGL